MQTTTDRHEHQALDVDARLAALDALAVQMRETTDGREQRSAAAPLGRFGREAHHLEVPFRVTLAAAAPGAAGIAEFDGYGSVFNTVIDAWMLTIIHPGAFAATLADAEQRDRIVLLWQHDTTRPIGKPLELREDARGLYLRGALADTELGREAATLLRAGVITEMSIGFDPVTWYSEMDPALGTEVRHITELKLWEISLVTFGANRQAKVDTVHRRVSLEDGLAAVARVQDAIRASQLRDLDREVQAMQRRADRRRACDLLDLGVLRLHVLRADLRR